MLKAVETYLTLRRATGFAMNNAEYLLKSFAAFAAERGQTHVHTQTAIDWAALSPSAAQRDARLKAVCRFARHVRVDGAGHELQRFIKDPVTGRRQARPNLPSEWLEQDVSEFAIVPLDLFEAAQLRRCRYSSARLSHRRRPKHLLSGLVYCGCCGASMIIVRDDRVGCSARMNKMTCDNRRTISLSEVEARILKVLQEHLLTPEVVATAIEKYRVERERLARGRAKTRRAVKRELAAVMRKIAGVITAIESGGDPRSLALRINELEAERRAIEARLPSRDANEVLTLHPKTAERYKQLVAEIHATLSKGAGPCERPWSWCGS